MVRNAQDNIPVAGTDCTLGLSSRVGRPSQSHCLLAELLEDAGAILFTKTNVPQTMLSFECSNPLFGTTVGASTQYRTPQLGALTFVVVCGFGPAEPLECKFLAGRVLGRGGLSYCRWRLSAWGRD